MKILFHCLLYLVSSHGTLIHLTAFCLIKVLFSVQNEFAVFFSKESYKVSFKKL